jgi:dihydrofolate synthase / folylpolyglutamate synthase
MRIKSYKTRLLLPPKDDLFSAIKAAVRSIPENSVLAVASKVVAIWQGRCVDKTGADKTALVESEADLYLPREFSPGGFVIHAIKNNLLAPTAGIDAGNGDGYYILWPKHPHEAAKKICLWAKKNYRTKNLGVVITDSHSTPMRRGTVGISLGYYGFSPMKDYRGQKDIFGRKLLITQANVADALAAAGVFAMGEGKEMTPIAVISNLPDAIFSKYRSAKRYSSLEVPMNEDLYGPFLKNAPWKRGKQAKGNTTDYPIIRP